MTVPTSDIMNARIRRLAGINVVKEWRARSDAKTRESHRKLDGEVKREDELFSNGARYPRDPNLPYEEKENCRCDMITRVER